MLQVWNKIIADNQHNLGKLEKSQSSFTWWSMEGFFKCLRTHRCECANYENGVLETLWFMCFIPWQNETHSKLDYGNALICMVQSQKIWTVCNLFNIKPLNLSSLLIDLIAPHLLWIHFIVLPIRERINFKICMYVFKCIHGNAPKYLSDFISHRLRPVTGPITRSSNDSTLIVAHVGQNRIGHKSFYVTAPRLWNALPRNIREAKSLTVFRKMLKSHLYPKYWLALCLYFALFFHLSALI